MNPFYSNLKEVLIVLDLITMQYKIACRKYYVQWIK